MGAADATTTAVLNARVVGIVIAFVLARKGTNHMGEQKRDLEETAATLDDVALQLDEVSESLPKKQARALERAKDAISDVVDDVEATLSDETVDE